MSMGAKDVEAILGPVDEVLTAEIIATGADRDELAEAWAWVNSDEALIGEGQPLPKGKVAELVELLAPQDDELEG